MTLKATPAVGVIPLDIGTYANDGDKEMLMLLSVKSFRKSWLYMFLIFATFTASKIDHMSMTNTPAKPARAIAAPPVEPS